MTEPRRALVAGASGLVGAQILCQLLADPDCTQVSALVRRPLTTHARLRCTVTDFAALDALTVEPADDAYCALGTTIRTAGSPAAFAGVDLDRVVAFARLARRAGCQRFMLVSTLSADPRSTVFYNRIKGEAEQAVASLGFDAVHAARPSFLLGPRSERRPGEFVAKHLARAIAPLLQGGLRRYRPVAAEEVARTLIAAARTDATGLLIHHFHQGRSA